MFITKVKVDNHKSFFEGDWIEFSPGFNIISGKNNSGKTALLECIGLAFSNNPHKTIKTVPQKSLPPQGESKVSISFFLEKDEILEAVKKHGPNIALPLESKPGRSQEKIAEDAFRRLISSHELNCEFVPSSGNLVPKRCGLLKLEGLLIADASRMQLFAQTQYSSENHFFSRPYSFLNSDKGMSFTYRLAQKAQAGIYYFKAERLNLAKCPVGSSAQLKSDAANLAEVLNTLQSRNPSRFARYNELVSRVFSQIRLISVHTPGNWAMG